MKILMSMIVCLGLAVLMSSLCKQENAFSANEVACANVVDANYYCEQRPNPRTPAKPSPSPRKDKSGQPSKKWTPKK